MCPEYAKVGRYAEIVCWCCGDNPDIAHPGDREIARRAIVKPTKRDTSLPPAKVGSYQMRPAKKTWVRVEDGSKAAKADGLKAAEEEERPKVAEAEGLRAVADKTRTLNRCLLCEKDDHFYLHCPWASMCPEGAKVGRYAEIVCWCCGENPDIAHPGDREIARRAVVKPSEPDYWLQALIGLKYSCE